MLLLFILPLVLMLKSERKSSQVRNVYHSVPWLHLCPESLSIRVSHHSAFFCWGLESYLLLSVSPSDCGYLKRGCSPQSRRLEGRPCPPQTGLS